MKSPFPVISHLDEVLSAIDGRRAPSGEFIVARKDGYVVIDYTFAIPGEDGSFPDPSSAPDEATARAWALRRECRGIVFAEDGRLVSRPFQKFFNVGERLETQLESLPWPPDHASRKLDGSMVRPFVLSDGVLRWGTRMGETEVSEMARKFIADSPRWGGPDFEGLARAFLANGMTPMFEWCDPVRPIVVRHRQASLHLLAARDMTTGEYASRAQLEAVAATFRVPVAPIVPHGLDPAALMAEVRGLVDDEGIVLAWPDGHRAKAKGDWYLQLHRSKDRIRSERDVLEMILDDALDDVLPALDPPDAKRLVEYASTVRNGLVEETRRLAALAGRAWLASSTRQGAYEWLRAQPGLSRFQVDGAAKALGDPGATRGAIEHSIRLHLGSGPRVDMVRHLWGGVRWVPPMFGNDAD